MGPLISVLIRFVFISWNFLSVWGLSWKEALSGWFLDHWGLDCSGPSDLFIWGAYSPLLLERAKPLPVSTAGLILANCSWVCQAPQLLPQDFSPQADSMQVTWLLVVVLHSLPFGGHHLVLCKYCSSGFGFVLCLLCVFMEGPGKIPKLCCHWYHHFPRILWRCPFIGIARVSIL